MSIFPNTRGWEQQELIKTKNTAEEGKKRIVSVEEVKRVRLKEVPTAYHYLIKMQH